MLFYSDEKRKNVRFAPPHQRPIGPGAIVNLDVNEDLPSDELNYEMPSIIMSEEKNEEEETGGKHFTSINERYKKEERSTVLSSLVNRGGKKEIFSPCRSSWFIQVAETRVFYFLSSPFIFRTGGYKNIKDSI